MIPDLRFRQALTVNQSGSWHMRQQLIPLLWHWTETPQYQHRVQFDAANTFSSENGMVVPSVEMLLWLYDKGNISGQWHSCLLDVPDPIETGHPCCVSFDKPDDAFLFTLRWIE